MTLDDFTPYVLPYASGCPTPIAKLNIRLAIIELCRKARVWREYQTAITSVALQTTYAYAPAANQQVCGLIRLTVADVDVPVTNPATGKVLDAQIYGQDYAYGDLTTFELHPARDAGLSIVTYSAVAPSIAATSIPDSMARYAEEIGFGALSRILLSKDKQYGDQSLAGVMAANWTMAVDKAKSDSMTGFARTPTRTTPVLF